MSIITNLWSTNFVIGLVAGFLLSRLWQLVKACWLNHRDGRHRSIWKAVQVDRRWMVGILAVVFLGWSVITTSENAADNERNARDAAAFAERVQACQARLIEAIEGSREVTAVNNRISSENDELSREERARLADLARFQSEWLGELLTPTDIRIAALELDDPAREEYGFEVTRKFFERAGAINARIDAIHAEQDRNDAARPKSRPELPKPSCGQ